MKQKEEEEQQRCEAEYKEKYINQTANFKKEVEDLMKKQEQTTINDVFS